MQRVIVVFAVEAMVERVKDLDI